jgi:hypothetical protein
MWGGKFPVESGEVDYVLVVGPKWVRFCDYETRRIGEKEFEAGDRGSVAPLGLGVGVRVPSAYALG